MQVRYLHRSVRSSDMPVSIAAGVGTAGGVIGSLCGVGGGIVMMPALKQFSKLTAHEITATSLFAVTIASSFGAYAYIKADIADVKASLTLASTSALGAFVGASMSSRMSGATMNRSLAGLILLGIPAVLYRSQSSETAVPSHQDGILKLKSQMEYAATLNSEEIAACVGDYIKTNPNFLITGFVTGLASGAFGVSIESLSKVSYVVV